MKRITTIMLMLVIFTSCGGGLDGKKLADENCDCQMKANAMDPADPKRTAAQDDCMKKNMEAWNKVKDNAKESEAFNKAVSECATKVINKSFGK